jgi:hypothetical protein
MFPHIVKLTNFRGAHAPIRNRSSRARVLLSGDQGKRVILVCNLPPRPLMWKGARGVRGTNSSPRSPRLKPDKNVQNVPMNMDEDPLCSDGPIDIMLKPKPGLVPHFSCTFRSSAACDLHVTRHARSQVVNTGWFKQGNVARSRLGLQTHHKIAR